MKYYAVTDDPNELLHYGRLGMKWGKHIFGDKPKSPGYKKALSKLKNTKNANERNRRYAKVAKNKSVIEKINDAHQSYKIRSDINRENRRRRNMEKSYEKIKRYEQDAQYKAFMRQAKETKNALKVEKNFDKILQKAREGRLRYGKLNDDQIRRVQERLASEETARKLGGREKPSWHLQKKNARREGKLLGITKGTAAAMEEVARAGTKYGINHLMNRTKLKTAAKQEGKNERIKNRVKNKKSAREIKQEVKDEINREAYEERLRRGDKGANFLKLNGVKYNAAYLREVGEKKKISEEQKRLLDNDAQLKNDIYRRIMIGDKKDDTGKIISRLNNERDDIYRQIYGKEYSTAITYDQPKYNSKLKVSPIHDTVRMTTSTIKSTASKTTPKAKNYLDKGAAKIGSVLTKKRGKSSRG